MKPWSVVDLSGDDAPLQRAEGPTHSFPPDPPDCLLEVAGEFSDGTDFWHVQFGHSGKPFVDEEMSNYPSRSIPAEFEDESVAASGDGESCLLACSVSSTQWQLGVQSHVGQFAALPAMLKLPWETGVMADIFNG